MNIYERFSLEMFLKSGLKLEKKMTQIKVKYLRGDKLETN